MLKNLFNKKSERDQIIDKIKSQSPTESMIKEASNNPDGWVYAIHGNYSDNDAVPPHAIVGAWSVNESGLLTNEFKENPNFDPSK